MVSAVRIAGTLSAEYSEYIKFLEAISPTPVSEGIDDGILIDSSGLPNAVHFPLTAVNNHNGVISQEVRLIYVVQQRIGLPWIPVTHNYAG